MQKCELTIEHVHESGGGLRVVGHAAVVARVCALRRRDDQRRADAALVCADVDAAVCVVVDHAIVVVPEHKQRRLGALPQHARQLQRAARLQILFSVADNYSFRL